MTVPQLTAPEYWTRYVVDADVTAIRSQLRVSVFESGGERFELAYFSRSRDEPCIVISPGSAGHAYVFAELAYRMHGRGYNVFVMPRHGGRTIEQLVRRHDDALRHIAAGWNDRVGLFGEGLGGYVTFCLALAHGPVRSIVCQNAPAVLTEPAFHRAVLASDGRGPNRGRLLPAMRAAARIAPGWKLAISRYLDFRAMVDSDVASRRIEEPMVEAYLRDPDFDRRYPLSAILSLLTTPPPRPLSDLAVPTMFIVPRRGFAPAYATELFGRLPPQIAKKLVEVDGSVFWMVSHPRQAADVICAWFEETLPTQEIPCASHSLSPSP